MSHPRRPLVRRAHHALPHAGERDRRRGDHVHGRDGRASARSRRCASRSAQMRQLAESLPGPCLERAARRRAGITSGINGSATPAFRRPSSSVIAGSSRFIPTIGRTPGGSGPSRSGPGTRWTWSSGSGPRTANIAGSRRAPPRFATSGTRFVKWYGTSTDVHDLKASQSDSKLRFERFSPLFKRMRDAFLATDADFRITFINPAAERRWTCGDTMSWAGACSKCSRRYAVRPSRKKRV